MPWRHWLRATPSATKCPTPGRSCTRTAAATGTIYMDQVSCNSSNYFLQNCSFIFSTANVTRHKCKHSEDIGVDCRASPSTDPQQWKLRLVGDQPNRGRLEVQPMSSLPWGTVCHDGFGVAEALAACRSLGYVDLTYAEPIRYFGGGAGDHLPRRLPMRRLCGVPSELQLHLLHTE